MSNLHKRYVYIVLVILSVLMSIKDKIENIITRHPRLVTFGIGLAITFTIGIAIGMVDHNSVFAWRSNCQAGKC